MKEEIRQFILNFYETFHKKEWSAFASCLHDNFTYFTDNCVVQNKAQFVNFLSKDNTWIGASYAVSDIQIMHKANENTAVCTYKTEFKGEDSGQRMTVKAIETAVLSIENNTWKIMHFHTSNKIEI